MAGDGSRLYSVGDDGNVFSYIIQDPALNKEAIPLEFSNIKVRNNNMYNNMSFRYKLFKRKFSSFILKFDSITGTKVDLISSVLKAKFFG